MKLSEFKKLAPASVPVASIPFRGAVLDLYPLRGEDIFWLLQTAPTVASAWADGQDNILKAIGECGPAVVRRIISAVTRATDAEVDELDMSAEEQVDIVLTALDVGLPEDLLGKLIVGMRTAGARMGLQIPTLDTAPSGDLSSVSSDLASIPTD